MPNKRRQAGDYFERRTRAALENAAYVVVRSAGSLGPADLVALKGGAPPMLISCKMSGHLPRQELVALLDVAQDAGAMPVLAQRHKPGWVKLEVVSKHSKNLIGMLHFPPREPSPRKAREAEPDDPSQLTIYDALAE
jgi:Holliday junction resolvase